MLNNQNYRTLIILLAIIFSTVSTACACGSNDTSTCFSGSCVNGTCTCNDGWKGDLCNVCDGRVLLDDATGKAIHC